MATSYHSYYEKFQCKRENTGAAGFLSDHSRSECKCSSLGSRSPTGKFVDWGDVGIGSPLHMVIPLSLFLPRLDQQLKHQEP
jgi:hypothetical protein